MILKALAVGSWWLAASSQQCAFFCRVFGKTSNHPGNSVPYSSYLVPCKFWLFPKLKLPFKGNFRLSMRFRKLQWDSWWQLGELCEVLRCHFEGDWDIIVLCTMLLTSCIFFNKCFYFSYFMAGYLLDRPHTVVNILMSLNFFIYMSIYLKMNLYLLKYLVDV